MYASTMCLHLRSIGSPQVRNGADVDATRCRQRDDSERGRHPRVAASARSGAVGCWRDPGGFSSASILRTLTIKFSVCTLYYITVATGVGACFRADARLRDDRFRLTPYEHDIMVVTWCTVTDTHRPFRVTEACSRIMRARGVRCVHARGRSSASSSAACRDAQRA